jgi:hypothetical protein
MVTARQGGWPLFYCFTSNGAPFDANAAYSRFRTYAMLKHGGDWSAATRALGEAGYGSAPRKGASGVTFSLPGTVQQADGAQPKPEKYQFIDSAEFRRKDYRVDWFVDWFLARGQPGVVAGPSKGMKTSTLVDLAVSVATGTPHMGKWNVPRRAKVALVSGESGGYTLQETFLRVLRSRNLTEDACDGWLKWEFCLPTFADLIDTEDFASKLGALGCELVVIDPFYLTLGAVDAKNMFEMGQVLRTVSELLLARHGVTPLIAHHANRLLPIGEPMELQHLAYSGLEQFARQYVFINRRSAYENDGRHELWYRYGGSAGHSGLYAVSIDEGVLGPDTPHRRWDVSVNTQGETRVKDEREKRQERRVASSTAAQVDDEAVMLAIDAECAKFAGATKTRIREASGLTQPRANAAVERLQEAGVIERVTFKKTGGRGAEQEVEGYKRADGSINYG